LIKRLQGLINRLKIKKGKLSPLIKEVDSLPFANHTRQKNLKKRQGFF
jgi:hypothetical protein